MTEAQRRYMLKKKEWKEVEKMLTKHPEQHVKVMLRTQLVHVTSSG